jgi:SM-20-related protein
MTPKQILDSFTETLMQDERILSARERTLLLNVIHQARTASANNEATQYAVRQVIATAVGETVAQRAFSVLGSSIVEHIVASEAISRDDGAVGFAEELLKEHSALASTPRGPQPPGSPLRTPGVPAPAPGPQPPGTAPRTPGVPAPSPGPQPPGSPLRTPVVPPPTTGPQTPGHGKVTTVVSQTEVLVEERPARLPAQCVVLDEFLAPEEVSDLMQFTIEHEAEFQASEVVSPSSERGVVNYEHRRSRVLMELGTYEGLLLERIKAVLPEVLEKLGMEKFDISTVEAQITASNHGDFFQFHSDNGNDRVASRHLTFVYFFHREPRQFDGGELRIHDARLQDGAYVSEGSYRTVVPRQNQIVFFPCELLHEITPVKCTSQVFADGRFTLNGWLRR